MEVHAKDTDNIIHNNPTYSEDKESEKEISYFIIWESNTQLYEIDNSLYLIMEEFPN